MRTLLAFSIIFLAHNFSENAVAQEKKNQFIVGISYALSYPVGNFADNSTNNENSGYAEKSIGISDIFIDAEFIFKNNLGVSSTYIAEDYNIEKDGSKSNIDYSCITLGPTYSFAITNKLALDLKLHLGYITSLLFLDDNNDNSIDGKGIGVDVRSLIRYQIFKRWCLLAQCGYLSSKQNFDDLESIKIQALNVGIGVGFKIK